MFEKMPEPNVAESAEERIKTALKKLDAERLETERLKAIKSAEKVFAEIPDTVIDAGLERAQRGRRSNTYKDPSFIREEEQERKAA